MRLALPQQKLATLICLAALLFIAACHDNDKAPTSAAIVKTYTSAPVTLRLEIDRQSINVAQQLTLKLSADMPEDYSASFPDFPSTEGSFSQTKTILAKPILAANNRVIHAKTYVLEAFLAGNYTIPPLPIKFSAGKKRVKIVSEALKIEVKSLLTKDDKDPDIGKLAPVVKQPFGRDFYILIAVIALAGGLAIFLLARYLHRRALKPQPPPTPSHILAHEALDKLLAANLLETGKIKLFHQRVSDILRGYIEQRFALKAPERTTEEFLYELGQTDSLGAEHKSLLHDFLTHCDLVKFAEHIPAREESLHTVELCRLFIAQTQRQASEQEDKK